jgi:hypothetical protein
MVTRTPASIASALIFAVAACGALADNPRQPAAQRVSVEVVRPASAVILRAGQGEARSSLSTSGAVRRFAVLRPAQSVVLSPRESSSQGGQR